MITQEANATSLAMLCHCRPGSRLSFLPPCSSLRALGSCLNQHRSGIMVNIQDPHICTGKNLIRLSGLVSTTSAKYLADKSRYRTSTSLEHEARKPRLVSLAVPRLPRPFVEAHNILRLSLPVPHIGWKLRLLRPMRGTLYKSARDYCTYTERTRQGHVRKPGAST